MGDLKPTVLALAISMPILAMIAVALRFEARRVKRSPLGADDYTILVAMIFSVGLCAATIAAVFHGNLGGHIHRGPDGLALEDAEFGVFSKVIWTIQFLSVLGLGFTKIGVILLYRRIFVQKAFRLPTYLVGALVLGWTIAFFFANFFDCWPISSNWSSSIKGSDKCIDLYAMFMCMSVFDIVTDAIILALPWYPVWKLQMPLRRKLLVCAIFLLGGFVVAAGIARLVFLVQSIEDVTSNLDYTYSEAPAIYWTIVEACIGIVSACLPTLRPLFSHYPPGSVVQSIQNIIFSSSKNSQGSLNSTVRLKRIVSTDRTSNSSLVPFGNKETGYPGENTVETTIGTVRGPDYYDLPRGVRVQTDLSQRDEMV